MFTKMPLYTILLYVTSLTTIVQSLPDYQAQIPNGHKVGHPCFANTVWKGVGHKYHGGGGFLNSFGEDFRDNSFVSIDIINCEHFYNNSDSSFGQQCMTLIKNTKWPQGQSNMFITHNDKRIYLNLFISFIEF